MKVHQFTRASQAGAGFSAVCLAIAAALPAVSLAQDVVLEEITVTAQKREQSTLEVPLTVDVFSADDMEKTGALNISEMQDFIPGFEMAATRPRRASRYAVYRVRISQPVVTPLSRRSTTMCTYRALQRRLHSQTWPVSRS